MPSPTKFFISSVAQDSLTATRVYVYDTLRELGHAPEMYEKTFGPWPSHQSAVGHCLEKVRECHIFLLFLHSKGGSYLPKAGRTVTHLEFIEACEHKKFIQVFVENEIKTRYFTQVKWVIKELADAYDKKKERNAPFAYLLEELRKLATAPHPAVPPAEQVDPYVWAFLHDIVENKGLYADDLALGVPVDWKQYASDLMRRGILLINDSGKAKEHEELAASFGAFTETALTIMPRLRIGGVDHWPRLLAKVRTSVRGTVVYEQFGGYTRSQIGAIDDCSAIAVFRRSGNVLEVIAADGDTAGTAFFTLDDSESFVSITYNQNKPNSPFLYYMESRRMFYLTFRVGEYVVSYHFPDKHQWNQQKFQDFHELVIDGIINAHANSFVFRFVNLIVGGL